MLYHIISCYVMLYYTIVNVRREVPAAHLAAPGQVPPPSRPQGVFAASFLTARGRCSK